MGPAWQRQKLEQLQNGSPFWVEILWKKNKYLGQQFLSVEGVQKMSVDKLNVANVSSPFYRQFCKIKTVFIRKILLSLILIIIFFYN